jgi:hypothetical protein
LPDWIDSIRAVETKAEIKLPKYESWFRYKEFLPLNVEGAYRHFALHWRR